MPGQPARDGVDAEADIHAAFPQAPGEVGDGVLRPADVAAGILGAVVKDPVSDAVVWQEYLETVVRERDGWQDFYRAARGASR